MSTDATAAGSATAHEDTRQGVWLAVLKGPRTFAEQILVAEDFNSLADKIQEEYAKGKRIHALHVPNTENDHSEYVAVMRESSEGEKVIFAKDAADFVKQVEAERGDGKYRVETMVCGDHSIIGVLRSSRTYDEAIVHNSDFAGFVGGIQEQYNTKKHTTALGYSADSKEWFCILKPPGENSGQICCGQTLEALFAELKQGYGRGERTRTVMFSSDFDMWLGVMKGCPTDSPGEQVVVANRLHDLTYLIEKANKEGRYVETLVYAPGAQETIDIPDRTPAPDYTTLPTVPEAPKPSQDEMDEIAKRLLSASITTPAVGGGSAPATSTEADTTVAPLPKVGPRVPVKPMPVLHKKKSMPGGKSRLMVKKR